jgi:hypothetical protein
MQQDEFDHIDAIRNLKQKAKIVQDVENRSILAVSITSPSRTAATSRDVLDFAADSEIATAEGLVSLQKAIQSQYEQDEQEAHTELLAAIDRLQPRTPVTSSVATSSASLTLLEAMRAKSTDDHGYDAKAPEISLTSSNVIAEMTKLISNFGDADSSVLGSVRPFPLSTATISPDDHFDKRRRF